MKYNQGVADSNARRSKHGRAARKNGENITDRVYNAWRSIKQRCNNPNTAHYDRYGGRGIRMHPEWANNFFKFLEDIGEPPSSKHTIDRIDNDGDYEPANVRWATRKEQANNRSTNVYYEKDGLRMNMTAWADYLGIPLNLLASRFKNGMCINEALQPRINVTRGELITFDGKSMSLRDWEKHTGIKYQTLWYRHTHGKPLYKHCL